MDEIYFCSRNKEFDLLSLSNFAELDYPISNGLEVGFITSEGAYQHAKYRVMDPEYALDVIFEARARTPENGKLMKKLGSMTMYLKWKKAKMTASEFKAKEKADWWPKSDSSMLLILKEKFSKNPRFLKSLLATGTKPLHESISRGGSNHWTFRKQPKVGADRGGDALGRLLQIVRAES